MFSHRLKILWFRKVVETFPTHFFAYDLLINIYCVLKCSGEVIFQKTEFGPGARHDFRVVVGVQAYHFGKFDFSILSYELKRKARTHPYIFMVVLDKCAQCCPREASKQKWGINQKEKRVKLLSPFDLSFKRRAFD